MIFRLKVLKLSQRKIFPMYEIFNSINKYCTMVNGLFIEALKGAWEKRVLNINKKNIQGFG